MAGNPLPLPPLPAPRPARLAHHPQRPGTAGPHQASARVIGAASTMLLATLAALSLTLLGACGGGEYGDEPTASDTPQAVTGGVGTGATTASASIGTTPDGTPVAGAAPAARQVAVDFMRESEYGPGDAPGWTRREVAEAATPREDRSAVPVDRQAQTRRGRYVSRAVAERTFEESGGRIVWVDAGCCAGLDPELPERIAFGMQAVLGDEAPLYVSGSDLRQAARLADRLDALGVGRVYLITP